LQLVKPLDIKDNSIKSISYGGIIFTYQPYIQTKKHRKLESFLTEFEKYSLISFAKERLFLYLNTSVKIPVGSISPIYSPIFKLHLGVFTSIYNNKELRGCIGTIETDNDDNTILSNVSKYIIESAAHDSRFSKNPITLAEFNQLSFTITILYKIKPLTINEYFGNKFNIGNDGLLIKQDAKSAYFLPSVANEFNNNKQELLEELCANKLGSIKKNCYLQSNIELFFNEGYEIKI
jgi:AmmeMemoRadiSam system protein A